MRPLERLAIGIVAICAAVLIFSGIFQLQLLALRAAYEAETAPLLPPSARECEQK